jgi:transglutaminase superfamily protein
MTSLGKLLRLSGADRRLLVTAGLLLAGIRLGLALLPYRTLRGLLDGAAGMTLRPRPTPEPDAVERIARAVTGASRAVPGAACLTQALAAQMLLERRGLPARVRVGVTRADGGQLLAHAWVESDGRIVLGGRDLSGYTPLAALERETR